MTLEDVKVYKECWYIILYAVVRKFAFWLTMIGTFVLVASELINAPHSIIKFILNVMVWAITMLMLGGAIEIVVLSKMMIEFPKLKEICSDTRTKIRNKNSSRQNLDNAKCIFQF